MSIQLSHIPELESQMSKFSPEEEDKAKNKPAPPILYNSSAAGAVIPPPLIAGLPHYAVSMLRYS